MALATSNKDLVSKRIISTALHQIDITHESFKFIPISNELSDLELYLSELLEEIGNKPQKRAYNFHRETTEFFVSLESFFSNPDLKINEHSESLASRLLDKEVATDKRYGHLGRSGIGHVKRGSFLQFLFREDDELSYLGVKIDHQIFLDEEDFKKKIGLSVANKIYKACRVSFDGSGKPYDIYVFDTNPTVSTYWWREFLELRELRGDAFNTRTASQEVVRVLNRLKKDHPADYRILRNSTIASFRQQGEMKYNDFVERTFVNYDPQDEALRSKIPDIVEKLNKLPEKKKFDTHFNLIPSEVPFKKSKISLTKEITLSIDDGINNLDEKIWSEKTSSGKMLVVIESPEGFRQFKLKDRV